MGIRIMLLSELLFIGAAHAMPSQAKTSQCDWCVNGNPAVTNEIIELAKLPAADALNAIRGKGVCVKVLESGRKVPKSFFSWGAVETPKTPLSGITKQKNLMGKTVCKGETADSKSCPTIYLASDAPRSTLLHEFLHYRQTERDPHWCKLSKELWSRPPTRTDVITMSDKEWDVHRLLWDHRKELKFSIEDDIAVSSELLEEAEQRKDWDTEAPIFIRDQKVAEHLGAAMSDYKKQLSARPTASLTVFEDALTFFDWLESHATDFGKCRVDATGKIFKLCDGTEVDRAELRELLAMPSEKLVSELQAKGFMIDVLCDKDASQPAPFHKFCKTDLNQKMFTSVTALHGEYLSNERRILLREGASVGTLVHEYLHSKQGDNSNAIYGKIYKKERLALQSALIEIMDTKIAAVKDLEKKKDHAGMGPLLKEFTTASDLMRALARWQDFIDERGLFLLYLRHAKELGVSKEDQALARKNMGFVCKNPALKKHVTADQCNL